MYNPSIVNTAALLLLCEITLVSGFTIPTVNASSTNATHPTRSTHNVTEDFMNYSLLNTTEIQTDVEVVKEMLSPISINSTVNGTFLDDDQASLNKTNLQNIKDLLTAVRNMYHPHHINPHKTKPAATPSNLTYSQEQRGAIADLERLVADMRVSEAYSGDSEVEDFGVGNFVDKRALPPVTCTVPVESGAVTTVLKFTDVITRVPWWSTVHITSTSYVEVTLQPITLEPSTAIITSVLTLDPTTITTTVAPEPTTLATQTIGLTTEEPITYTTVTVASIAYSDSTAEGDSVPTDMPV